MVKRLWGLTKTRYRGLYKNLVRVLTSFALTNLCLLRKKLIRAQERCAQRA